MEKVLEMTKILLNNNEEVTDIDIDDFNEENIDFQELIDYLRENNIVSIYNEEKDKYIYMYKKGEE